MRPEHIELVEAVSGDLDGTVDGLEYLGADTFVIVSCGDAGQMTVRVNGSTDLRPGDKVSLAFVSGLIHAFNQGGVAIEMPEGK